MAKTCDIITIIITILLCVKYFKEMVRSSRYIVYFLLVILYIVPIVLDYTIGLPTYTRVSYSGFNKTYNDELTRIIYDIAIIFCQIVILRFHRDRIKQDEEQEQSYNYNANEYEGQFRLFLIIFMVLPILLTIIFPVNKSILFSFQWREFGRFPTDKYTSMLEKFTYPGVVACALLFFEKRNKVYFRILCIIFMLMNICIEGKRSILFFLLVTVVLIQIPGLKSNTLSTLEKRRKLILLGVFAIAIIAAIVIATIFVKINNRGYSLLESDLLYTTIRVDLFRDDRVRMAIYSILHPTEMRILDFPGQTILPIPTWFFPIDYILTKIGIDFPSYQVYFSSALRGVLVSRDVAYMTPCLFAELISNFGFFGIVIMPFICVGFSNLADRQKYPYNVLVLVSFLALQLYTTRYIVYLYEMVLIIFLSKKVKFTFSGNRL